MPGRPVSVLRATILVAIGLAGVAAVTTLASDGPTQFGTHTAQCLTHRPMDAAAEAPWTASVDVLYFTPAAGSGVDDDESGSFSVSSHPLSIGWPADPNVEVTQIDDSNRIILQAVTTAIARGCSGETV